MNWRGGLAASNRDAEVVATGGGRRRDETRQHGGTAAAQPHPPATDGGGTAGGHVCGGSQAMLVEWKGRRLAWLPGDRS